MSLTVSQKGGNNFPPIPDGTYPAVCYMVVDLGEQVSEQFGNMGKQVLIGWVIPSETLLIDGEEKPRVVNAQYRLSLNPKANLYNDLVSWRGKEFTREELDAFDLKNILGKPCMVSVTTKESGSGKKFTKVKAVIAMPKGMKEKPELTIPTVAFDMTDSPLSDINNLPEWVQKKIIGSPDYEARLNAVNTDPVEFTEELADSEDDLPF